MPINLSSIKNELLPGLRALTGTYDQIPREWDQIFDVGKSEMALERTTEMAYLGFAQLKTEGAATTFDNAAGERFTWNQSTLNLLSDTRLPAKLWTTTSTSASSTPPT